MELLAPLGETVWPRLANFVTPSATRLPYLRKIINEPASEGDGAPMAVKTGEQASMPLETTEPTSAQQLPSLPSAHAGGQSLPFHVAIAAEGLEIRARIKNEEDAENLVQILQTMKPLLHKIYRRQPSAVADPSDPPDIEGYAQRGFEGSTTPEAETGISFFITNAQKAELRRRGYSEQQIHEMKPEDAHRALGLIADVQKGTPSR